MDETVVCSSNNNTEESHDKRLDVEVESLKEKDKRNRDLPPSGPTFIVYDERDRHLLRRVRQ
jgi:hypothetical protein